MNETFFNMTKQISVWGFPWVFSGGIFILWVLGLTLIKRILIARTRPMLKRLGTPFEHIIENARFPLTLMILGSGIYIAQNFSPLPAKWEHITRIIFQASVVIGAFLFLDRLIQEFGRIYEAKIRLAQISQGVLKGIVRGIILGLGLLIFLDLLGISITPILASLGIGSISIGLALQETLTNFFSGLYINIDKPIRVGDFVKLESGDEGYVAEIGWRNTRIRMLSNNMVIMPNQKLMASILTNYYLPDKEIAVLVPVGVHYDSDLKKVEAVTVDVAKQIMKTVPGAVPTFEPFIRYHTFDSSSINFTVILRAKEFTDQYLIKHEFVKALHARYQQEGIVIPYPLRTIHLSNEVLETLSHLPRNH